MNVPNIITKTVGAIGLGLIAYDSHIAAKIESAAYPKECKANSLVQNNMDYLTLDSPSIVKQKVKKGILDFKTDETISEFCNGILGYFKGFGNMLTKHAVPLTLATGTVLTKGIFSKAFGAGLIAYGGIFLAQEFFGIGKSEGAGEHF